MDQGGKGEGVRNERDTDGEIEVRFRGSLANVVKLRRMAQALKVEDVSEWEQKKRIFTASMSCRRK